MLFSSLYAYRRVYDGFETESALASLTQETRAQKSYVAEAQARYENTRAFRHDVKNHLTVLGGFLKAGNIGQAQTYLRKLDAATGELSFPFTTGNPVVDILLENKLALARRIQSGSTSLLRFQPPVWSRIWTGASSLQMHLIMPYKRVRRQMHRA